MKVFNTRKVFLSLLFLLICGACFTIYVSATESSNAPSGGAPAQSSEDSVIAPPSDPGLSSEPEAEVSSEPAPESEISSEPVPTPEPEAEVSDEPEPTQAPQPDPTQAPAPDPEPTDTPQAYAVDPPASTSTPRPTKTPATAAVTRPKATLSPGGTGGNNDKPESNYVVFARLGVKQNSLSANMFLLGLSAIGLGCAGLLTLLVLFILKRRHARQPADGIDGIFEEIQQAENRHAPAMYSPYSSEYDPYGDGYDEDNDGGYAGYAYTAEDAAYGNGYGENPGDGHPNMGEHSGDFQDDAAYYDDDTYDDYAQQAGYTGLAGDKGDDHYSMPAQPEMYTAEFYAAHSRAASTEPAPPEKLYSTMEILREALGSQTGDDA